MQTKSQLIRWFIWLTVIIPGIPFILGSLAFIIFAFWPRDLSGVTGFKLNPGAEYISISAHGVKDNHTSWSDKLQQIMGVKTAVKQQNISLDWQKFADDVLICSVSGKRIGYQLGKRIALETQTKLIHAVGHSCGSFVVLGLCEGAKEFNKEIKVQTTYLDPVSVYAGFFWQYGIEYFGSCADFSDTYIDTQDTVPGSNQNLPNSYTFDVTALKFDKKIQIAPHNWPTKYYLSAYEAEQIPLLISGNDESFTDHQLEKLMIKAHN